MSLQTLKEVLVLADQEKRGVGMFNVVGVEYAEAIVQAAEAQNEPVILALPGRFMGFHEDPSYLVHMMLDMATQAKVPVVVHLDHGANFDIVMKAIRLGFTSVMFDGSALPFEENVAKTAELARIAHSVGVSIEGELGYLGFQEGREIEEDNLTKPTQAREFVDRTHVDALAVAIGNMHGHYKGTPHLDLERLSAIHQAVNCPLVLHGGSGLSPQDFQNAIERGISKVNIFTNMNDVAAKCISRMLADHQPWQIIAQELTSEVRALIEELIATFARHEKR